MANTRKNKLPKRDQRGRIRVLKGKFEDGTNARFQIADIETSDAEADRRLTLISLLYEKQCRRNGIQFWNTWCFKTAQELGKGNKVTDAFLFGMLSRAATSSSIVLLREWGIPVHIANDASYREGLAINKDQIETMVADMVAQQMQELQLARGPVVKEVRLPDAISMTETTTLGDAINSYQKYMERTGERGENGGLKTKVYNNIREMERIKKSIPDHINLPLWKIDRNRFEEIIIIWRNRPLKEDGIRCKKGGAAQIIKKIFRFIKWLDTSEFQWKKPDGIGDIDRTPIDLPEDDNGEAFQTITKPTYTPSQLAIIMDYCNDHQRAMIATCVNCAFGQSEIGQWKNRRVRLFEEHPHQKEIDFLSSNDDSWIVGPRPKTKLYGEHLLWSEVATALQKVVPSGQECLWVTKTGKPIYKTYSNHPSSEIDNWWTKQVIKKVVKDHPDFPALPFGSLRDVLPNLLTRDYGQDVATLALQHKTFTEDDLLKCYANLPFKRLFNATKELRDHFSPMLAKLTESSPKPRNSREGEFL